MLKGKSLTRDLIVLFSLLFLIRFYEDYRTLPMRNRTPKKHAHYVASRIINNTLWYLSFGKKQLKKQFNETFPEYHPIYEGSDVSLLLAQLSTAREYLKQDIDASDTGHNQLIATLNGTESYVSHIHQHYGPQEGVEGTESRKREYARKLLKVSQKTSEILTDVVNELKSLEKQCPTFISVKESLSYNEAILKILTTEN